MKSGGLPAIFSLRVERVLRESFSIMLANTYPLKRSLLCHRNPFFLYENLLSSVSGETAKVPMYGADNYNMFAAERQFRLPM